MAYAKVAISATSLGCSPWWNSNNSANFGLFMPLTERINEIIAGALNLKPVLHHHPNMDLLTEPPTNKFHIPFKP